MVRTRTFKDEVVVMTKIPSAAAPIAFSLLLAGMGTFLLGSDPSTSLPLFDQPVAGKLSGIERIAETTNLTGATASSDRARLNRAGLTQTFLDDFKQFSWYAEDLPGTPTGGGTWRTNFGYQGPQGLGSRTLPNNKELELYVDRAFRGTASAPLGLNPFHITDRGLEITAERAPEDIRPKMWNYQYTSGLITSQFSFHQQYGVFEIRARMPKGRGFWPAFWLTPVDRSWPPEIDILEILGHEPTKVYSTAHTKQDGKHSALAVTAQIPDSSLDFHTYSVDWEKDNITWYFDDVEIGHIPTPADTHKAMYIIACLGVGGGWPGNPDASTVFPNTYAIRWIRAYQRGPS
jgi:beta-glucanase (GH16 family)